MKKIQWKTLLKNKKTRKLLIIILVAAVAIAGVVTAAVMLDAGTVKLVNSNLEAGRVSGGGRIANGASKTIHAVAYEGYEFLNWTNTDGTVASTEADHRLIVPKSTVTLTANWTTVEYPLTLHLDSEENTTVYPESFNVKSDIFFLDPPTKEGHTFLGWYKDAEFTEEADDYVPTGTTAPVELYARWAVSYTVTYDLVYEAEGASNNPDNPDTYTEFKDVELKHPIYYEVKDGVLTGGSYRFLGWKDAATNEPVDVLRASWKKEVNLVATWDTTKAAYYNTYEKNGDTYVEFGRYPQHLLEDKRTISDLNKGIADGSLVPDATGVYTYNNSLFVKLKATPYQNDAKTYFGEFGDGSDVKAGEEYFFIVEPITWKVLSGDPSDPNAELLLLSESVLTAHLFREDLTTREFDGKPVYANNWEYSDIRAFLNGEFVNMAFKGGELDFVLTTTVDYSKATSNRMSANFRKYANGDDCEDKVFLLSYQQMFDDESYGWTSSKYKEDIVKKGGKATDYAKAVGVYASVNKGDERDNAHWWLRSSGDKEDRAEATTALGSVGATSVKDAFIGVRPAITVKFGH